MLLINVVTIAAVSYLGITEAISSFGEKFVEGLAGIRSVTDTAKAKLKMLHEEGSKNDILETIVNYSPEDYHAPYGLSLIEGMTLQLVDTAWEAEESFIATILEYFPQEYGVAKSALGRFWECTNHSLLVYHPVAPLTSLEGEVRIGAQAKLFLAQFAIIRVSVQGLWSYELIRFNADSYVAWKSHHPNIRIRRVFPSDQVVAVVYAPASIDPKPRSLTSFEQTLMRVLEIFTDYEGDGDDHPIVTLGPDHEVSVLSQVLGELPNEPAYTTFTNDQYKLQGSMLVIPSFPSHPNRHHNQHTQHTQRREPSEQSTSNVIIVHLETPTDMPSSEFVTTNPYQKYRLIAVICREAGGYSAFRTDQIDHDQIQYMLDSPSAVVLVYHSL